MDSAFETAARVHVEGCQHRKVELTNGPSALCRFRSDCCDSGREFLAGAGADVDRKPAVAILGDAFGNPFRRRAHQDRRTARLYWLGPAPERIEIDELAVKLRNLFGPDFPHCEDTLARDLPANLDIDSVVGHLLGVPPRADPEQESPVGHLIYARDRLGQVDRIMLRHQADRGPYLELGGHRRRGGQRDKRVGEFLVELRQFAAHRERSLAAGGYMRMLTVPQRLEAV